MKKYLTYFVITATLLSLFVPVAGLRAQSCDPSALKPVSFGQRGAAVKNLQLCLMELNYDIPAGATGYYGNQTKAAVRAFYKDHLNMSWSGNSFGPKGVEAMQSALAKGEEAAPSAEAPSGVPGISVEALAQVLQKIQAGDTAGALALLLQLLGGQVPTTTQQQPTQQQPTQEQPTQQPAQEATVEVRLAATPASGVVVKEDQSADVLGIRVISRNGYSDVQRVRFDLTSNVVPTKVFKAFELYDGSNKVASVSAGDYIRTASNVYQYNFIGLSVRVNANSEKVLTIRAVVNPTVDSSDTGKFDVEVKNGYVRAVDGVGVQHTPDVSGTVSRSFTVEKATPTGVQLVIYRDQNSPYSNNWAADTNRDVKDLELVRFVLRADNDTLKIHSITGSLSTSSSGVEAVSSLKLVDANGNVLDSVANPTSPVTFQGVDFNTPLLTVGKDQTVVLKVLADVKVDSNLGTTSAAWVDFNVTGAQAERSDQGTISGSGSADGDKQYLYRVVAANWKVLSTKAEAKESEGQATSTLTATFRVQVAAQRGDVYIPKTGFTATSTGPTSLSMGTPYVTPVSNVETSGNYFIVRNGNTGVLDVQFALTPSSWNSGYHAVQLQTMTWDNDNNSGNGEMTTNFPGTVETNTLTNAVYIAK